MLNLSTYIPKPKDGIRIEVDLPKDDQSQISKQGPKITGSKITIIRSLRLSNVNRPFHFTHRVESGQTFKKFYDKYGNCFEIHYA